MTVAHLLTPAQEASDGDSGDTPVMEPETASLAPEIAELAGVANGSVGAAAKAVQQLLIDAGIELRGGADGAFGPVSQAALKSFQNSRGLEATGVADEATLLALTTTGATQTEGDDESAVAVPSEFSQLVGLRPGALGDSVAALQRRLLDLGITVRGGADGIFGPATASSLKTFQEERNLEATGIVDEATALQLSQASSENVNGEEEAKGSTLGFGVYGEQSNRVQSLQNALIQANIVVRGGADGVFGSATAAAVMAFQRREELHVTGVVDTATGDRLGLAAHSLLPTPRSPTSLSPPSQCKEFAGFRMAGTTHVQVVDYTSVLTSLLLKETCSTRLQTEPSQRSIPTARAHSPVMASVLPWTMAPTSSMPTFSHSQKALRSARRSWPVKSSAKTETLVTQVHRTSTSRFTRTVAQQSIRTPSLRPSTAAR